MGIKVGMADGSRTGSACTRYIALPLRRRVILPRATYLPPESGRFSLGAPFPHLSSFKVADAFTEDAL